MFILLVLSNYSPNPLSRGDFNNVTFAKSSLEGGVRRGGGCFV